MIHYVNILVEDPGGRASSVGRIVVRPLILFWGVPFYANRSRYSSVAFFWNVLVVGVSRATAPRFLCWVGVLAHAAELVFFSFFIIIIYFSSISSPSSPQRRSEIE